MKRITLLLVAFLIGTAMISSITGRSHRDDSNDLATSTLPRDHRAQIRRAPSMPRVSRITRASRASRRIPATRRLGTASTTTVSRLSVASELASWIEQARAHAGLRWLRENGTLAATARSHSASMAADDQIYHTSRSQLASNARRACSCQLNGEIVGLGTSVRRVFDAFMAEPGHRAVIMNEDLRYLGVGVIYARGAYWVTVQFAG